MPHVITNLIRFVGDSRAKVERQDPRVFRGFLTSLAAEVGDNIFDVDFVTLKFAFAIYESNIAIGVSGFSSPGVVGSSSSSSCSSCSSVSTVG